MKLERNYGLDLFRIIAMLMIVAFHVNGFILKPNEDVSWITKIFYALTQNFLACCVNCFAMLTGFLLTKNETQIFQNLKRLFYLWFQILFYSVSFSLIFMHFGEEINIHDWYQYLTPICHNNYWYMTAYFGAFVFFPMVTSAVNQLPQKKLIGCFFLIFIMYSFFPSFLQTRNVFGLNHGYSTIWILTLAFLGNAWKRIMPEKSWIAQKCLYIFIISNLTVLVYYIMFYGFGIQKISLIQRFFDCYISPLEILNAFCLLTICYHLKITNEFFQKILFPMSSLTLGVYLFHVHPLIWKKFFSSRTFEFSVGSCSDFLLWLVVFSLGIFLCGTLIDFIRKKLFDLLRIEMLCTWLDDKTQRIVNKFYMILTDKTLWFL